MIPYFSSKFGPFVTNAQIRNILGQVKSGFDFRDVMDKQKILLINLSGVNSSCSGYQSLFLSLVCVRFILRVKTIYL